MQRSLTSGASCQIRELQLHLPADAIERITSENRTLRQEKRKLTTDNEQLPERLKAARENNRFLDTASPASRPSSPNVLDLDELADALHQGQITAAQCATVLSRAQRFIDRHLRADEKGSVDPPHQFPPAGIAVLVSLPCFIEQSPRTDVRARDSH